MPFEPSYGIVTGPQCLPLDAGKPSMKAREGKWILFPRIDKRNGKWFPKLSAPRSGATGRTGGATGFAIGNRSKPVARLQHDASEGLRCVLGIAPRSQPIAPSDAARERMFLSASSVGLLSISIEPLKSAPSSIVNCAALKSPITEPPFLISILPVACTLPCTQP